MFQDSLVLKLVDVGIHKPEQEGEQNEKFVDALELGMNAEDEELVPWCWGFICEGSQGGYI